MITPGELVTQEARRIEEQEATTGNVWVAVRVIVTGTFPGIAFMGVFTRKKAAKKRCQFNCSSVSLTWHRVGPKTYRTQAIRTADGRAMFYTIARKKVNVGS